MAVVPADSAPSVVETDCRPTVRPELLRVLTQPAALLERCTLAGAGSEHHRNGNHRKRGRDGGRARHS